MNVGSLRKSLNEYLAARSSRERAMLGAAAAAMAAAVLYVLMFGPGLAARAKLSAALPGLRAQIADMRQQEKEISLLRKKSQTFSQSADLKAQLQSAVARTSFVNSVERIDSVSLERVTLIATPVVFDDWAGWVGNLQREFGVRLDACKITALDQPGLVRIEATFVSVGQPPGQKAR
jgi:general secretion pathway protein M